MGEGSPTKIDYRKEGTLILTSLLDLAGVPQFDDPIVAHHCYLGFLQSLGFLLEAHAMEGRRSPLSELIIFLAGRGSPKKLGNPSESLPLGLQFFDLSLQDTSVFRQTSHNLSVRCFRSLTSVIRAFCGSACSGGGKSQGRPTICRVDDMPNFPRVVGRNARRVLGPTVGQVASQRAPRGKRGAGNTSSLGCRCFESLGPPVESVCHLRTDGKERK